MVAVPLASPSRVLGPARTTIRDDHASESQSEEVPMGVRRLTLLAAVLLALAAAAIGGAAWAPSAGAERSIVDRQLQELKAATARYHSIEQAIAAGYLPPGGQMPPPPATCVLGADREHGLPLRESSADDGRRDQPRSARSSALRAHGRTESSSSRLLSTTCRPIRPPRHL